MKMVGYLTILAVAIATQSVWACLPPSPYNAVVGRISNITANTNASQKAQKADYHIEFSRYQFVFRPLRHQLRFGNPDIWQSNLDLTSLNQNDLFIGMSDLPSTLDGQSVATLLDVAPLYCHNDVITVGKPLVPYFGWNHANQSCRHDDPAGVGILDGFVGEGEAYYLAQLQAKYPTCAKLQAAFPSVNDSANASLSFWDRVKSWFGF